MFYNANFIDADSKMHHLTISSYSKADVKRFVITRFLIPVGNKINISIANPLNNIFDSDYVLDNNGKKVWPPSIL